MDIALSIDPDEASARAREVFFQKRKLRGQRKGALRSPGCCHAATSTAARAPAPPSRRERERRWRFRRRERLERHRWACGGRTRCCRTCRTCYWGRGLLPLAHYVAELRHQPGADHPDGHGVPPAAARVWCGRAACRQPRAGPRMPRAPPLHANRVRAGRAACGACSRLAAPSGHPAGRVPRGGRNRCRVPLWPRPLRLRRQARLVLRVRVP